jgi:hypothetical protein
VQLGHPEVQDPRGNLGLREQLEALELLVLLDSRDLERPDHQEVQELQEALDPQEEPVLMVYLEDQVSQEVAVHLDLRDLLVEQDQLEEQGYLVQLV